MRGLFLSLYERLEDNNNKNPNRLTWTKQCKSTLIVLNLKQICIR